MRPSRAPAQPPRRLRVGVIVGSLNAPAWIAALLQEIAATDFLELSVVVVSGEPRRPFGPRWSPGYWSTTLFRWYAALDYRLFSAKRDAFAVVDLRPNLPEVPIVEPAPEREGERVRGRRGWPQVLAAGSAPPPLAPSRSRSEPGADLDVMLDLNEHEHEHQHQIARYGIWSLHHGGCTDGAAPALFWEIHDRNPVSATRLEMTCAGCDEGRRHVLYRSFARTDFISLYRSRNTAYWKTAQFVLRRLRDLHRNPSILDFGCLPGDSILDCRQGQGPEPSDVFDFAGPIQNPKSKIQNPAAPGNLTMARFLGRQLLLMSANVAHTRLFHEQWFLALRRRDSRDTSAPDMTGFDPLIPPGDRFYADPFLFTRGAATYLFFEEYPYASAKGVISCMEVGAAGPCGEPRIVLEKEYHLSYPFVFEWQGQVYMIPETRDHRTIELYRAVDFPHEWALEKVLMDDVSAVDATLFERSGTFWLFANVAVEGASVNDELFLFRADSPLGPWEPHPQNPIVSDVRRARPAGRLFVRNGQLIRPSQDCSTRYGAAIWFNRVDLLSETEYRETPIARIAPDWSPGNLASHTYNANEVWEVVDGQRPRRKKERSGSA